MKSHFLKDWRKRYMLGYKIYFNGNEFVADNTAMEVQNVEIGCLAN